MSRFGYFAQRGPKNANRILWRWRHSPLMRRTDKFQAWVGVVLVPTFFLATPVATLIVGNVAHQKLQKRAHSQARTRLTITTTLVHDSPQHLEPGSDEEKETRYPVRVRYTDPHHHRVRTGTAHVEPGLAAGSTTRAWVDGRGNITNPPLTEQHIFHRTIAWALVPAVIVPLTGTVTYRLVSLQVKHRNLAGWESAWRHISEQWSRGS